MVLLYTFVHPLKIQTMSIQDFDLNKKPIFVASVIGCKKGFFLHGEHHKNYKEALRFQQISIMIQPC